MRNTIKILKENNLGYLARTNNTTYVLSISGGNIKKKKIWCIEGGCNKDLHYPQKNNVEPAFLFSSFAHNSSINELINMKLSEHMCYEMIN